MGAGVWEREQERKRQKREEQEAYIEHALKSNTLAATNAFLALQRIRRLLGASAVLLCCVSRH